MCYVLCIMYHVLCACSVTDLNPTLCDAWAAVVVTITILFLVGPLLKEIARAHSRLSKEKLHLTGI